MQQYPWAALSLLAGLWLTGCAGGGGGDTPSLSGTPDTTRSSSTAPSPHPPPAPLVGIADSGFRLSHESLEGRVVEAINLHDPAQESVASNALHGTAVASLVTANSDNGQLYLAKVNDDENSGVDTRLLDYSVGVLAQAGARVINHSYSLRLEAPAPGSSYRGVDLLDSLHEITRTADGLGSVYVVAAANDGQALSASRPIHEHPELFSRLIIAGGSNDDRDDRHPQSNYPGADPQWQSRFLAAPWYATVATDESDDSYATGGGTSLAAPVIAAYAAELMALWPHLDAQEVSRRLLESADRTSVLYEREDCGDSGTFNCGEYYLGQGVADRDAALAPQGELMLPSGDRVDGPASDLASTQLALGAGFGDAGQASDALADIALFDDLGRDYRLDLSTRLQGPDATQRMRQRLDGFAISANRRPPQELDHPFGKLTYQGSEGGAIHQLQFSGQCHGHPWQLFSTQASQYGPFPRHTLPAMLSLQPTTATAGWISGLRQGIRLGPGLLLEAQHWRHHGEMAEGQRQRSDLSLRFSLGELELAASFGWQEEADGPLGSRGRGALDTSTTTPVRFQRLELGYGLHPRFDALALYERGELAETAPRGLINTLEGVRSEELALGLRWQDEEARHGATLLWYRPQRVSDGHAELSVPVGRTLGGEVTRETRRLDLTPSGRQQDWELSYRYRPTPWRELQINLVYTQEPGHQRTAPDDLAAVIRASRRL